MSTELAAPAGAAEPVVESVSATVAAADAGDFSTFLEADRSAREGKPFEKVTRPKTADAKAAPGPTGKGGEPAKGPSPQDRDADARLTARIREAVDTSTADLRRQLDEAKAKIPAAPKPAEVPAGEPKKASDEYKRILALPTAPKAEEYDTTTELAAAQAAFITSTQAAERADADRNVASALERETKSIDRVRTFHGRIEAYKATNPDFAAKLAPDVRALHGFSRLQQINAERAAQGQPELPATVDHAIAEQIYDTEVPAQTAVFLSEHPDEFAKLRACKTPEQLIKAFAILEHTITAAAKSAAPVENTETAAALRSRAEAIVDRSVTRSDPPPAHIGKAGSSIDPLKAAIEKGDIGTFMDLDRQERVDRRFGRK